MPNKSSADPGKMNWRKKSRRSHLTNLIMKKLSLWTLLTITILSISCTNDFTIDSESKQTDSLRPSSSKLDRSNENVVDQNSLYPQIDTLLAQFYDQSNFDSASIISINQAIHPNTNTTVILVTGNLDLTNSSIDQIRTVANQSQFDLSVENSSMTLAAKASLSTFIENVMLFNDGDYESILKYIELYQSIITADDSFTSEDKNVILRISSIGSSSLFYERKRRDKDWETAVANRNDDFIPTDEITFKTVRMALLAGIIQNN